MFVKLLTCIGRSTSFSFLNSAPYKTPFKIQIDATSSFVAAVRSDMLYSKECLLVVVCLSVSPRLRLNKLISRHKIQNVVVLGKICCKVRTVNKKILI